MPAAGVQSVSMPFKVKALVVLALNPNTRQISDGLYSAENDTQVCRFFNTDANQYRFRNTVLIDLHDGVNSFQGKIVNVSETGFDIEWSILSGTPSGTAELLIFAMSHGKKLV